MRPIPPPLSVVLQLGQWRQTVAAAITETDFRPRNGMDATTLIVVEDDPTLRRLWHLQLESLGYRVRCFATAEEALINLSTVPQAGGLVTDLSLPGLDGLALVRRVREHRPGMPALIITGTPDNSVTAEIQQEPNVELLHKPARLEDIEDRLAGLL